MIGDCHGVHSFAVSGGLALASTSDNGVRVVRDKDNEPEPASRILLARDGERNSRARRRSAQSTSSGPASRIRNGENSFESARAIRQLAADLLQLLGCAHIAALPRQTLAA
jgi:hypothetical protein